MNPLIAVFVDFWENYSMVQLCLVWWPHMRLTCDTEYDDNYYYYKIFYQHYLLTEHPPKLYEGFAQIALQYTTTHLNGAETC